MILNSWKFDLWGCLGALWAPSWRQDGPRMAPRVKINEKCLILGLPVGSNMEPKFEFLFFRSWVDFGSKNLSKMKGLGVTFSTSLRVCEKCDFEQPSFGFAIFFDFKRVEFRPQNVYFSKMFSRARFGLIFDGFWDGFSSKLGAKMESKSYKIRFF